MTILVLLPGLDGTGSLFDTFVVALTPKVQTIVVSYPCNEPLNYAELEIVARSYLPKNEPYYLLAESFSGPIAISIAASSPPGLQGLILCCSFAKNPLPIISLAKSLINIVPVKNVPLSILGFFVLGDYANKKLLNKLKTAIEQVDPAVLRARSKAAVSVNMIDLLPNISVPLLYLRATHDRIISRMAYDLIATHISRSQIIEFQAPHFLLQTAPEQAALNVTNFMESNKLSTIVS